MWKCLKKLLWQFWQWMMSDIKELTKKIEEMRQHFGWQNSDTPNILAKSLVVEAGELLEAFLEADYDIAKVSSELADVLMYALSLANDLGLDINDLISEKIEEVKKRRYE